MIATTTFCKNDFSSKFRLCFHNFSLHIVELLIELRNKSLTELYTEPHTEFSKEPHTDTLTEPLAEQYTEWYISHLTDFPNVMVGVITLSPISLKY